MSDELTVIWNGASGYCLGENYGKGALLPPHNGNCTLTEAARGPVTPPTHDTGSKGTQTRYGPETRRAIRALYHTRTIAEIARERGMPMATVRRIVQAT